MTRFEIAPIRATEHEDLIRSFWQRYLSATPMGRLEWLERNPAGPAIWLFARDRSSGEIAGMIAVTRKQVRIGDEPATVGILGDLMVAEGHRVFGPSLQLIKMAIAVAHEAGLPWVYTVPNPESLKIVERAGFQRVATLKQLVRPVRATQYLERRLPAAIAGVVGTALDGLLRSLSRDSYGGCHYRVDDLVSFGADVDRLWDDRQLVSSEFASVASSRYLAWRYLENPMYSFRLLGAWYGESGRLTGVLPYTRTGDVLRIYDIITEKPACLYVMLRTLRSRAREDGCKSIEIAVTTTNPWRSRLRRCGFFDSRADVAIYAVGSNEATFESWAFFGGDRNI